MSFSTLVINNHGQLLYRGLYERKIAISVSDSACLCSSFKLCECVLFLDLKNVIMESGETLLLLCVTLVEYDIRLYGKE